ncbi:extracellular solute-binding protein [Paenibacillus motobuensis]|uniref:extracellular solute-binding protein n=1 Tax=Paenibacillus TaxID=44249 RepID=UPI00203CF0AD|nr:MULTISPECIES: extracellular solute-binding protein [Paenibacillus]MCM3041314.1 extracellular solute-binding protein [Paenibacillus lutimineralis]MCM3648418.1 extracellular solute-binding protein [Paenibacillus motobuensis]
MNQRWRWASLLLVSVLLFLTACSNGGGANNAGGSSQENSGAANEAVDDGSGIKPVTFSFYGHYDWLTTAPWGENEATQWIKENRKVTVEPVQSGGAAEEKLNTMIVSDNLPDVIFTDRGAAVERLVKAGKLVALDDYYEKYPNFKKYVKESTLNLLRSEDGKIYQIPNWYTSGTFGNGGWMVNKDIYNELGRPALETFDDLYQYLLQVRDKYPNVVPLEVGEKGAGLEIMYGGFKEDSTSKNISLMGYPEGDKLVSIYEDPAFEELMLYVNKLFRERLITQDALQQTQDAVKEKVNTGRVAVMIESNITTYGAEGHRALTEKKPDSGYEIIWPIRKAGLDKNNVFVSGFENLGWNVNVITTKAKDSEAIFAYYDWVTGPEGQKVLFFGPKGLFWDEEDADGAPIPNERYKTGDTNERTEKMRKFEDFNWAGNTTFIDTAKMSLETALSENQRSWETVAQSTVTWATSKDITEFVNTDPIPDTDIGIISQNVRDIFTVSFAKMVHAKSDDEVLSVLATAKQDSNKAGLDKLLQFRTERWQENVKKINMSQ